MGRKSCQSRASMARSPLTHTVNYACSEHKHRFYSKTVLYIHTQTWNTRSFSHLTALLLRWTLLYLANTSSAASLKTNMLIRRMNNVKSETLNNKKRQISHKRCHNTQSAWTSVCFCMGASVLISSLRRAKTHIKLPNCSITVLCKWEWACSLN